MLMTDNRMETTLAKDTKPARSFVAGSRPSGDGYSAHWASPGLLPRTINNEDGQPFIYRTAAAAEAEARRVLFDALNAGIPSGKNKDAAYEKMTAADFAVALSEVNLSPSWFAFVMGTHFGRVIDWINGAQDIPHTARVMLGIFAKHPAAIDTAEAVTEAVASDRVTRPTATSRGKGGLAT